MRQGDTELSGVAQPRDGICNEVDHQLIHLLISWADKAIAYSHLNGGRCIKTDELETYLLAGGGRWSISVIHAAEQNKEIWVRARVPIFQPSIMHLNSPEAMFNYEAQ